MLGYIFAQSALLYALFFVIINIYSVYSIYFGVGYFTFIQGYIIYKKVCFQVGSEIKSSIISQISFVKGQRMVFTSCQNSWTHFRFYQQTFAGYLSLWLKIYSPTSLLVLESIKKQKLDARLIVGNIIRLVWYQSFAIKGLTEVKKHPFKLT